MEKKKLARRMKLGELEAELAVLSQTEDQMAAVEDEATELDIDGLHRFPIPAWDKLPPS